MSKFRVSTIWLLVLGFLAQVAAGVATAVTSSVVALIIAGALSLIGWVLFVTGTFALARAKGYTGGWASVGLLGLLGIIGLISLLLLPDRDRPVPVSRAQAPVLAGASASISLDRCPSCGRLVRRGEPCPDCEAKRAQPRSHAWDLRIVAAVIVALIALGASVSVGLAVAVPAVREARTQSAAAHDADAAAKSLVRNAMTALESAYIEAHTYSVTADLLQWVEPSIDFHEAPYHVLTVDGERAAETDAESSESAVDYYGTAATYSISTIAETGTVWAVFVDKTMYGGTWFARSRDGVTTEGW